MKNYLSFMIVTLVAFFTTNSLAYTPPPAPDHGGYVSDQAGKLSESQIQQLNQKVEQISKATKNEFGILLLQDMGGDNIEDVANATFKAWGVGKHGLDNGVLIVVAIKERKSRIETGKGVGGEITDLQANDILKKNLNPHLKSGDFFGGFNATLDALSGLMETRAAQQATPVTVPVSTPSADDSASGVIGTVLLVVFGLIVGLFGLIFFIGWAFGSRSNKKIEEENERLFEIEQRRTEQSRQRAKASNLPFTTPIVSTPVRSSVRAPVSFDIPTPRPSKPVIRVPKQPLKTSHLKPTTVATASVAAAAISEAAHQAKLRQQREDEARRGREREEEDRRRRRREEEESSSSSSSSSSFDWGGGSSSGSDSGGGFGGGDSGGGGSSSDW